jgi:deoxycytidylate deaminase
MIGGGGRRSRRSGGSEAMPLLRCLTKQDMARVVHADQCATIRAGGKGVPAEN